VKLGPQVNFEGTGHDRLHQEAIAVCVGGGWWSELGRVERTDDKGHFEFLDLLSASTR